MSISIYPEQVGKDFFLEVAKGKVAGHTIGNTVGINPVIDNVSFSDMWDEGGTIVLPSSAQSLEVKSDDPNDAAGGTGCQAVLVETLDADYNKVSSVVVLDGTTPVAVAGTHIRPDNRALTSVAAGSAGINVGNITLQLSGDGDTMAKMRSGLGRAYNGFFTVPAGKTAFTIQLAGSIFKNEDVNYVPFVRLFGSTSWVTNGSIQSYQSLAVFPEKSPIAIGEKTDVTIRAKSFNPLVEATLYIDYYLIDNEVL